MTPNGDALDFKFYLSSDLDLPVKIQLQGLRGCLKAKDSPAEPPWDRGVAVYAEAVLAAQGEVVGLPCRTRWAEAGQERDVSCVWEEWLEFPVKYRDLPHDVQLGITVCGVAEARPRYVMGGATMRLFSKKGRLKDGPQVLQLSLGQAADMEFPSSTPGKLPLAQRDNLGRLKHLLKRHRRGELHDVPWLDGPALRAIEQLQLQAAMAAAAEGSRVFAEVEVLMQLFPHAVMYHQAEPPRDASSGTTAGSAPADASPAATSSGRLVVLSDPEVGRVNPCELKAQKLARSRAGASGRDAKPDTGERKAIAAILNLPPNKPLKEEDRTLLWRFRWALTGDQRALTRVLKCVNWTFADEARQALALTAAWAPVGTATALELLSPEFANAEVRAQAVTVLKRANDAEISCYLLQLSAALRYEQRDDSLLARFLVQRASSNLDLGVALHWLLCAEWEEASFGKRVQHVYNNFRAQADRSNKAIMDNVSKQMQMMAQLRLIATELGQLRGGGAARKADRLKAMLSPDGTCSGLAKLGMACPLDPSVRLAGIVPSECSVFKSALSPLKLSFRTASTVNECSREVSQLEAITGEPPLADTPESPHTPDSMDGQRSSPAVNKPSDDSRYIMIYKTGDDLRQDQLVLQMFSLMDRLLKDENLDLKLTPYRVLPTSATDGLIEFVPSVSMAHVLAVHKTIHSFLSQHNPDPDAPDGMKAEALDTFVKSCAGYCVMTYILGVGDRHLDNLMLCPDGRLFHIDFGFIMGRDPKPFPPPMKLCKEMVELMGGADGAAYRAFRTFACEAYNILRRSAGLLLSLFHLMAGTAVADLAADPSKALLKLQDTLRLDMDDESAVAWMQQLLNESATALMPQIMETGHKWAQYWR